MFPRFTIATVALLALTAQGLSPGSIRPSRSISADRAGDPERSDAMGPVMPFHYELALSNYCVTSIK